MRTRFALLLVTTVAVVASFDNQMAVALSPPPLAPVAAGISLNLAVMGAYIVLKTGMSSREYAESLSPNFQKLIDGRKPIPGIPSSDVDSERQNRINAEKDPHVDLFPGAVPIRKAGVIVGAVSATGLRRKTDGTGFDTTEPCAVAGRDKIEAGFQGN